MFLHIYNQHMKTISRQEGDYHRPKECNKLSQKPELHKPKSINVKDKEEFYKKYNNSNTQSHRTLIKIKIK